MGNSLAISLITVVYWLFTAAGAGFAVVAFVIWVTRRRHQQGMQLAMATTLLALALLAAATIVDQCVLPYITGELSLITQR